MSVDILLTVYVYGYLLIKTVLQELLTHQRGVSTFQFMGSKKQAHCIFMTHILSSPFQHCPHQAKKPHITLP